MVRIILAACIIAAGFKAFAAVQSFADTRAAHVARIAEQAR